jgi:hypothetical protein
MQRNYRLLAAMWLEPAKQANQMDAPLKAHLWAEMLRVLLSGLAQLKELIIFAEIA